MKVNIDMAILNAGCVLTTELEAQEDWSLPLQVAVQEGALAFNSPIGPIQVACVDFIHAAHFQIRLAGELKMEFLVSTQFGHEWLWGYFYDHFRCLVLSGDSYVLSDVHLKCPARPWVAIIWRSEKYAVSQATFTALTKVQDALIGWFLTTRMDALPMMGDPKNN